MSKFTIIIIIILFFTTFIAGGFGIYKNNKRVQDANNRISIYNDNITVFNYVQDFIDKNKSLGLSQKELDIRLKDKFGKLIDSISIEKIENNKNNSNTVDVTTKQQFNYPYSVKYSYCFYCYEDFQPKSSKNIISGITQPNSYKINNSWIVNYEK
ncbi:MAG: hypothetical protein V3575_02795 [Candidatus Absconditabacteria bacterium]